MPPTTPSNTFSMFSSNTHLILVGPGVQVPAVAFCCYITGAGIRSSKTSLYCFVLHLIAPTFAFPSFIDMSSGSRHHGKPAASLQHGPPTEPQWIWAAWYWKTPNSHQTSSYSYTCWNWGKPIVIWVHLRFEIMSVLGTLLD